MSEDDRALVGVMAAIRIAIGAAAVLAPGPSSRLFGFPREQDSPTSRLMGRLFGVRDVALGALVLQARGEPESAGYVFRLNAAVDAGDAAATAAALIGRQGIDRAALSSLVFAVSGAASWLRLNQRGAEQPALRS